MKYLYLIRHCDSRVNSGEEPDTPRHDAMLSTNGVRQAEEVALHLRGAKIDVIFTSPFLRAEQTAAVVAAATGARTFAHYALSDYLVRDDGTGVESIEQGLSRAMGLFYQTYPLHESVCFVSHQTVLATMLSALLNIPFMEARRSFRDTGTCVSLRFDFQAHDDEKWELVGTFSPDRF